MRPLNRLLLVQYPHRDDEILFRAVEAGPSDPIIPDTDTADLLQEQLRGAVNTYGEAEILVNMYRGQWVLRHTGYDLDSMLTSQRPVAGSMRALEARRAGGYITYRKANTLASAICNLGYMLGDNNVLRGQGLMTPRGVVGSALDEEYTVIPDIWDNISDEFGEDSVAAETARLHDMTHYIFQYTVEWQAQDDATQLSRIRKWFPNAVLGHLIGGAFNPGITLASDEAYDGAFNPDWQASA